MSRAVFLIVLVLFGTTLVGVCGSRTCYLCNSYNDIDHKACVDPISPYPAVNYTVCPDNYDCTRVSYITQKQYVVSRGCDLSGNTCNNIYQTLLATYPDLAAYNCYSCTANYCNGANGLNVQEELKEVEALAVNEVLP